MSETKRQVGEDSLLSQSFDITMMGVFLTTIISMVNNRISGQDIMVVCCFLASVFVWKLIYPLERFRRYRWWQIFCLFMVGGFSWWLVSTAESTRAGWYRFNVLQHRVQSLVNHAPAYVIMGDSEDYITATSDNIEVLTGYTQKELVGQQLTVLMRDAPAAKHLIAYEKAIIALRDPKAENQGWMLQGQITVGIKHKNGNLIPVKAYAGGIRWSTDIQFKGDIDTFAIFVPVNKEDLTNTKNTVSRSNGYELQNAPPAPPTHTVIPMPSPLPLPLARPDDHDKSKNITPR